MGISMIDPKYWALREELKELIRQIDEDIKKNSPYKQSYYKVNENANTGHRNGQPTKESQ